MMADFLNKRNLTAMANVCALIAILCSLLAEFGQAEFATLGKIIVCFGLVGFAGFSGLAIAFRDD